MGPREIFGLTTLVALLWACRDKPNSQPQSLLNPDEVAKALGQRGFAPRQEEREKFFQIDGRIGNNWLRIERVGDQIRGDGRELTFALSVQNEAAGERWTTCEIAINRPPVDQQGRPDAWLFRGERDYYSCADEEVRESMTGVKLAEGVAQLLGLGQPRRPTGFSPNIPISP